MTKFQIGDSIFFSPWNVCYPITRIGISYGSGGVETEMYHYDNDIYMSVAWADVHSYICGTPPCIPAWVCESPLNGYEKDGCGNRRLNAACDAAAGCTAGATRRVKCPSTDKTITQNCVNGIWQTTASEEAKCGTGGDVFMWMLAGLIIIMIIMLFGKGK